TVQLDGLDTPAAVTQHVAVVTCSLFAIDDGFLDLQAEARLLVVPHAFQNLPRICWQGTPNVFDAQTGRSHTTVMLEESLLVTVVPAVDLAMQKMFDGFLRTHRQLLGFQKRVKPAAMAHALQACCCWVTAAAAGRSHSKIDGPM